MGLDLWRSRDQTGNSLAAARHNLEAEGVSDRCELQTGDMTTMPFPDATFDLVVSSLAIHNIAWREGRFRALDEAVRVLKPRGRLLLAAVRELEKRERFVRRWSHLRAGTPWN